MGFLEYVLDSQSINLICVFTILFVYIIQFSCPLIVLQCTEFWQLCRQNNSVFDFKNDRNVTAEAKGPQGNILSEPSHILG